MSCWIASSRDGMRTLLLAARRAVVGPRRRAQTRGDDTRAATADARAFRRNVRDPPRGSRSGDRSPRTGGPTAHGYHPAMEVSGPGIFDLGLVLLLAAGAGWLARALSLPAVVGYLAVGLAISPFTPGYVADRAQLTFLADIGVVLLLFEVGIEIDLGRLRREHGAITWTAPL